MCEQPGWIYNSSELYAMRFSAKSLDLCVGDKSRHDGKQALREVCRFSAVEGTSRKQKRPSKSQLRKYHTTYAASCFHE